MIDSRLDIVAQTIREAQAEPDRAKKLGLVEFAADEWKPFADEFPSTDVVVAVVTRRLATAQRQLRDEADAIAGLSLQVAANAVTAVKNR